MTGTNQNGKLGTKHHWTVWDILALYLVSWFALIPLFQTAHFALADHSHRYCSRHNRIEDVPRRAPRDDGLLAFRVGRAIGSGEGWKGLQQYLPCAVLNLRTFSGPALDTGGSSVSSQSERHRVVIIPGRSVLRSCALLLTAPKTSPSVSLV